MLDKSYGAPLITNDGVTIAKEIELEDRYENMGAQLVKEVATKTNDTAGDGTTTATVLTQALIREGLKNIAAGANPIILRKGMKKAKEAELWQAADQPTSTHRKKWMRQRKGWKVMRGQVQKLSGAVEAPLRAIAENAGLEGAVIVNKVREKEAGTGFDAVKEEYVDMFKEGIIDPVKVTKSALENAVSISATLLTTEAAVADIKEKNAAVPAAGGADMDY